jgi:UDP:flavonoid glycosyltransferase YjiC (YdhE family)
MEPKKILFASMPFDGHFNPLTSLAMHLKESGHDVRWYAGSIYKNKLESLGIQRYPFRKALEVNQFNADLIFPQRNQIRSEISKLKFDVRNAFILRVPEFYEDIKDLAVCFNFDILICDITFTGAPFVKEKMGKPVIAVGVLPIAATSRDLAPNGLALTPATSFFGKRKQDLLRLIADKVLFRTENELMHRIFEKYGVDHPGGNVFDVMYRESDVVLQSGSPGFEYKRSDLRSNIRFAGAILPYAKVPEKAFILNEKLKAYDRIILVTQGTAEKDTRKLIEPTLRAFAGSNYLVIATTGGSNTIELKEKYNSNNIIIEDYIPFREIMPCSDVFITNGGYGGVMLGIEYGLPMLVSGVHEGKNEINARVGFFKLGINLKTENPSSAQIVRGVEELLKNTEYADRVRALGKELSQYDPNLLCDYFVAKLMEVRDGNTASMIKNQKVA